VKRAPERRAYRLMDLKRWREGIREAGPSDAELDEMHDALTAEAIKRGVFGAPELRGFLG
jgi:hypothetical protein